MAWGEGAPKTANTFSTQKQGENNRSSCCQVSPREGRSKLTVSTEETSKWHAFVTVLHRLVFFSPEKTLWRNIGVCALLLLWSLTPLLWSFAGQVQAVVLVRN